MLTRYESLRLLTRTWCDRQKSRDEVGNSASVTDVQEAKWNVSGKAYQVKCLARIVRLSVGIARKYPSLKDGVNLVGMSATASTS